MRYDYSMLEKNKSAKNPMSVVLCSIQHKTHTVGAKSQLRSADHDKAYSVDWFNGILLLILLKK